MFTDWILWLLGNALICLAMVGIGYNLEKDSDRQAVFALRTKVTEENEINWEKGQKLYSLLSLKGGLALLIINGAAMLCVIALGNAAITVAGVLMVIAEVAYFFGMRWYVDQQLQGKAPNPGFKIPRPSVKMSRPSLKMPKWPSKASETEEDETEEEPAAIYFNLDEDDDGFPDQKQ